MWNSLADPDRVRKHLPGTRWVIEWRLLMNSRSGSGENPYIAPASADVAAPNQLVHEGDRWTLQYDMQAEDLLAFTRHHYLHTTAAKRHSIRHWLTVTGSLLMIGLAIWQRFPRSYVAIGIVSLGLFDGLTFPWLYRARISKLPHDQLASARDQLASGRNVGLLGLHQLPISSRGLDVETAAGKSLTYWHGIERIDTDSDDAFIYWSSVTAFVVALREFANPAEFDAFVSQMRKFFAASVPNP